MSLTIDSHPKVPHCLLEIWKKNGGKKANSRKEIRRMTRHFMPPRSSTIQQRLCLKPCAMLSGSDILSPWLFNFATTILAAELAANKSLLLLLFNFNKFKTFLSLMQGQTPTLLAEASEVVWAAEVKSTTSIFFAWRLI